MSGFQRRAMIETVLGRDVWEEDNISRLRMNSRVLLNVWWRRSVSKGIQISSAWDLLWEQSNRLREWHREKLRILNPKAVVMWYWRWGWQKREISITETNFTLQACKWCAAGENYQLNIDDGDVRAEENPLRAECEINVYKLSRDLYWNGIRRLQRLAVRAGKERPSLVLEIGQYKVLQYCIWYKEKAETSCGSSVVELKAYVDIDGSYSEENI